MLFPLTPVPISIGIIDVMLLNTDKAKRTCYLLKIKLLPKKPDNNFALVIKDRNTLLHALIKDMPCNLKEISLKLFGMVSSKKTVTRP